MRQKEEIAINTEKFRKGEKPIFGFVTLAIMAVLAYFTWTFAFAHNFHNGRLYCSWSTFSIAICDVASDYESPEAHYT